MLSNLTVGLIAGLGVAAFVYSKVLRSTGGRTKDALVVGASAGGGTLLLITTLLSFLFH